MIKTSPWIESLKDALTWWCITWGLAFVHQFFVRAEIEQILLATWWQFTLTSVNGFIVLRCYNFFKNYLATNFSQLDEKSIIWIGAFITSLETFLVTYGIQKYGVGSKSPETLAFLMQWFSCTSLAIIYERILERRKTWKQL